MTKQVRFNNEIWDVISEMDRDKTIGESLANVTLLGTILHIRHVETGEETKVYPWDVWGMEEWENLDGTCDESKLPEGYY
jgi:hypothetical protein